MLNNNKKLERPTTMKARKLNFWVYTACSVTDINPYFGTKYCLYLHLYSKHGGN